MAGSFYPREQAELAATVEALMSRDSRSRESGLIGLIAPHAGYMYSGPVAASAFASLGSQVRVFERVLLIGPPHYVPVHGIAAPSSQTFTTPLGEIEIDRAAIVALLDAGLVTFDDRAHAPEHSLEVELPFCNTPWPLPTDPSACRRRPPPNRPPPSSSLYWMRAACSS